VLPVPLALLRANQVSLLEIVQLVFDVISNVLILLAVAAMVNALLETDKVATLASCVTVTTMSATPFAEIVIVAFLVAEVGFS
jgi:hypothetical protein